MSRVTAVMNGVTMIARMTPAASMEYPAAWPPNSPPMTGRCGRRESRTGLKMKTFRNGIRMKMPHRPYTTLGMAARSSIRKVAGVRIQRGASSDRKMAAPTETGTARTSAMNDEYSVPWMKGRAW